MFFKRKRGMDFLDRGDPAAVDYNKDTLTLDGNWHDLDLSGIMPNTARLVMIRMHVKAEAGEPLLAFRKKGNVNLKANDTMRLIAIDGDSYQTIFIACSVNGIIEYNVFIEYAIDCNLTVAGWWA